MLTSRRESRKSGARKRKQHETEAQLANRFVFANGDGNPYVGTSINHLHRDVCAPRIEGKRREIFPADFVLHSLRHTMLTRLGESGVDAFTIMRIAGHSSIVVSQRYIHQWSVLSSAYSCLARPPRSSRKNSYSLQYPLHCRSRCP